MSSNARGSGRGEGGCIRRDTAHRSSGQVARAVPEERRRLLAKRRVDHLADLPGGDRYERLRVEDLQDVVVGPVVDPDVVAAESPVPGRTVPSARGCRTPPRRPAAPGSSGASPGSSARRPGSPSSAGGAPAGRARGPPPPRGAHRRVQQSTVVSRSIRKLHCSSRFPGRKGSPSPERSAPSWNPAPASTSHTLRRSARGPRAKAPPSRSTGRTSPASRRYPPRVAEDLPLPGVPEEEWMRTMSRVGTARSGSGILPVILGRREGSLASRRATGWSRA